MKLQLTYHFEDEAELRAHLGTETRALSVETPVETVEEQAAPVEAPAEERTASDVDADGMPYDAAVHSDPPSTTADGLWRAKRGKGDEAKAARAAFKAAGGDMEAPTDLPATPSMPGMPGVAAALPADAPAPITLDRVIEKITGMMERAQIDEAGLATLYAKHSGLSDPQASFGVFNTNESARANLYADLCEIEPELK